MLQDLRMSRFVGEGRKGIKHTCVEGAVSVLCEWKERNERLLLVSKLLLDSYATKEKKEPLRLLLTSLHERENEKWKGFPW